MNTPAALWTLTVVIFGSLTTHMRSQIGEEPRFDVEIRAGERPLYFVTNQNSKTLTACAVRFSFSSTNKKQGEMVWDSLLVDEPPVEPNAHMSGYVPHVVGNPYPDKVEIIAGVWADGETFGQPEWVKTILTSREMEASAYEKAANFLQHGLDENWTRDQFLQALEAMPSSIATYSIRSTLQANQNAERARLLRHILLGMLDTFTGKYERIRKAKPATSVTTIPK
jgi:hypothetical protein